MPSKRIEPTLNGLGGKDRQEMPTDSSSCRKSTDLTKHWTFSSWVWGITLVGVVTGMFIPEYSTAITIVFYLVVLIKDRVFIENNFGKNPNAAWGLIPCIYFYRRLSLNRTPRRYFWLSVLYYVIGTIVLVLYVGAFYNVS